MPIDPNIILQGGNYPRLDAGQMMGNALGVIGARDAIAQRGQQAAMQQRQIAREDRTDAAAAAKQQRGATLGTMAAGGDVEGARAGALQAGDTDLAATFAGLDDNKRKRALDNIKGSSSLFGALSQVPAEMRRQAALGMADQFGMYGIVPEKLGTIDYSDNGLALLANQAMTRAEQLSQSNSNRTYAAGRSDHADTLAEGGRNRDLTVRGQNITRQGQIETNARAGSDGMTPKEGRRETTNLRKQFDALPEVKSFKDLAPVIISARRAPDTPAGDVLLAYTVGKVLDPNSVVREGELTMVAKAGSPVEQIIGAGRFTAGEGGRLTKTQRGQLMGMLNERALANRQAYDAARENYSGYATEGGIDPQSVVGTHVANAYAPKAAAKPGAGNAPPAKGDGWSTPRLGGK